ncbi:MAG TPA: chemotaxis response regulator protein-glutamate methylesterase [Syntrophorhabdaceae bacterium]|nr:chemotaxis response regulator protein-glutamate methylesterase [Syntrophorhabdaceae bacterium]
MPKIRVFVVDDSAFMRGIITKMLESDDEIEVIGSARNGQEAIEKIGILKPDVVTLDIEMPIMNGIETLKYLMKNNPLPVIMFSALTSEGAEVTLEALNIGASDFITKDFSNFSIKISGKENELVNKVKNVAKKKSLYLMRRINFPRKQVTVNKRKRIKHSILAIGASTGGPPAIENVLSGIPGDFPVPIVISQHMPKLFTKSFAQRLNNTSQITVKEAENGEALKSGIALIAPGDTHMGIVKRNNEAVVEFTNDTKYIYRPSVDLLFSSVAQVYGMESVCVILTGMGNDGMAGAKDVKAKNGYVIAQDEDTCVVYGMPRAVIDANMADIVLPLDKITEEIMKIL